MIGIIGAMHVEIELLVEKMQLDKTIKVGEKTIYIGKIGKQDVCVCQSGIGKVKASSTTQMLIDLCQPSLIINTGIAGGLQDGLKVYDIVLSQAVVQHDFDTFSFMNRPIPVDDLLVHADEHLLKMAYEVISKMSLEGTIYQGVVASGDQFIFQQDRKDWIKQTYHAICCEMEGAAIGQVCHDQQVPFVVIRAISDTADGQISYEEFEAVTARYMANIIYEMVIKMA